MSAEVDYLFRHAVLRDAAYQLQLPIERARLHAAAFAALAAATPAAPGPMAEDLADHARLGAPADASLGPRELAWLDHAAAWVWLPGSSEPVRADKTSIVGAPISVFREEWLS